MSQKQNRQPRAGDFSFESATLLSMKAYFIRHGQTQFNVERRITGSTDIPLTEEGIQQAYSAAENLPADIEVIYCGDSQRHIQTAEILNQKLNLPIITDPRLREKHFGSLEGQHWDVADPTGYIWDTNKNQIYDYREYGGECVEDVRGRIKACLLDVQKDGRKALIVTSAGVIRLIDFDQNGVVIEAIENASFHEFELPEDEVV